ncbi:MAG: hypothetical protein FGM46_08310 [Ferruginibacter sp.]|nr:hypothetical protein [Ferruginibacter sp.]
MKHKFITNFIFFYLFNSSFNSFGQIRQNREVFSFENRSEKITDAIGWKLNNKTGNWIENKNVIYDNNCKYYWVSHIYQNFKWIQFASLLYNGKKFYVLIWESQGGEYKYPNIREQWEQDYRTYFFILDSSQYNKLRVHVNVKEQTDMKIQS